MIMKSYFVIDGKIYSPIKRGKKLHVKRWGIRPYQVMEVHEYRVDATSCESEVTVDILDTSKDFSVFMASMDCNDIVSVQISPRTIKVFSKDLDV
jgi:hypothetical protein